MAETAITAVLSKIGELAVSEAKILLRVGDDIIILRDRLEWLQAFVRDADRKRRAGTDGLTRVWVRQTRDVAFDAEDALDDFFHEEVVGLKVHGCRRRWKTLRTYFTGFFTKIVVRHGLSDRMKIISNRLEHISLNQKEYQIVHTPSVVLSSSTTAIAAWRDDLENAKGFNYDAGTLLAMLYKGGTPKPMFVSIVGKSGAGKSTLARVIRRRIRESRDVKVVWYNMEPGCSTENFLKEVHQLAKLELTAQEQADASSDEIGRKLYDVLNGRNFLFILGGISSKSMLNSMRASLPVNGCQVMLLLDTENEDIAWHADTMNGVDICAVYLLTRLVEKRTRNLFFWKVLRKHEEESDDDVVDEDEEDEDDGDKEQAEKPNYGRLVHKITGGYPMAIVLLAGLLRFKEKPLQWNAVLQQLMSENNGTQQVQWGAVLQQLRSGNNGTQDASECLPNTQITNLSGGTRRAMEAVFWASFEDLHNDLRSCFLYFASYPTNSYHPADQLVRMWIGEGFIKPRRGKSMEEVGHEYLKELVLRCLVEVEEMKANGGIQFVRVHKSLMGFLESEALEAGFMEIHGIHDVVVPPSVRRLSVQSDNGKRYNVTFASKKFPKLRSFICRIIIMDDEAKHQHDLEFLLSSRFLRIISVEGLNLSKLPAKIGDMIQLRYLRIDCRSLVTLPLSIARLLNLQTLDISNTGVEEIANDFWKIRTLRHVLASDLTLPTKMPIMEEGHDESGLQTLHGVKPIASENWTIGNCPLDKMTSLLSLEMHGFQYAEHGGPALEEALKRMHLLGHLKLQGDVIPLCVFTDPSLRSLETMELHGQVKWKDIVPELENSNVVRAIIPENTNVVGEIVPENNSVVGDIIPKENINVPGDTFLEDNVSVVGNVVPMNKVDAVSTLILDLRPNLVQIKLNDINPVSPSMKDQLWEIIVGEKRATVGGGAKEGGEGGGQRREGEEATEGELGGYGGEGGGQQREGGAAAEEVGGNEEGGEGQAEGAGGKREVEAGRGGAEEVRGAGGQAEGLEPRRGGPQEVGGEKGDGQEPGGGGAEKTEVARGVAKGGEIPQQWQWLSLSQPTQGSWAKPLHDDLVQRLPQQLAILITVSLYYLTKYGQSSTGRSPGSPGASSAPGREGKGEQARGGRAEEVAETAKATSTNIQFMEPVSLPNKNQSPIANKGKMRRMHPTLAKKKKATVSTTQSPIAKKGKMRLMARPPRAPPATVLE